MKKVTLILAAAIALVSGLFAPKSAEAVPAFARQVGVPCFSCHYQHIPKLNAFGREFAIGGMTQTAQDLISDEGVSLPPVLNAGFIMKFRYLQNTKKTATDPKYGEQRGELQIPDEAALWLAGRVAENWGAAVEFPGPAASMKLIYSKNFGGVQGGLVVSSTDASGVAWNMEVFNTGAVRPRRQFENRGATSIQQSLGGPAAGAYTGINFFASSPMFFANVGLFGPAQVGDYAIDTGFDLSTYYRIAVTPKLADGLDLMVGIQGTSGKTKITGCGDKNDGNALSGTACNALTSADVLELNTETMAIDFQVQTDVAGMSLEVVGAYQANAAASATKTQMYNSRTTEQKGFSLSAELGLSKEMGLKLGFLSADNGATTANTKTATSVGVWYDFAQNIDFDVEYSSWSGDARSNDSQLLAMVEFGF
ncbi:MAG: hypothetical protein HZA04_05360 [Nitrospinae bacterium]|nr:hypothetical protein [Nitrospinota bacterium]